MCQVASYKHPILANGRSLFENAGYRSGIASTEKRTRTREKRERTEKREKRERREKREKIEKREEREESK
jgi:hypothetical protein